MSGKQYFFFKKVSTRVDKWASAEVDGAARKWGWGEFQTIARKKSRGRLRVKIGEL